MKMKLVSDDQYQVETDSGKTVILSVAEIFQVHTFAEALRARLRPELTQVASRAIPVVSERVSEVKVGLDIHHTEINLRFQLPGHQEAYIVPPDIARFMRDALTAHLLEIEQSAASKTKQ